MIYTGEVHNGVVVLKDAPDLAEGTRVTVEVEPLRGEPQPRRGSAEVVLKHLGKWDGPEGEIDRLLAEVRQLKQEELQRQLQQPDEQL